MDFRHLLYFATLAEERNFRRAAHKLGISQPPLSQLIMRLEEEYGHKLFIRHARDVELTDAGRILLESARSVLAMAQETRQQIERVGQGEIGELTVSFTPGISFHPMIPALVRLWRRELPAVELTLRQAPTDELCSALGAGTDDIALIRPPIEAPGNLVYVGAAAPTRDGEAILVKANSPIRSVADLKGKTVALGRGTSSHNLLIAALEKAALSFSDIKPAYLLPSDAGSAFANDSVDAWVIWDPYLALAQSRGETRVLATTGQTHDVASFFLANRTFAEKNPSLIAGALSGLTEAAGWARAHRDEVAQSLASVTGVPYPVQKVAADRTEFAVRPLSDEILTAQQTTADRFFRLGLIPRPIKVRDIVWSPPRT
ncbi:aliphatic sulfonate ABC transporter substrate-binding protein [Methylobacterium hispanicum]|uniref:LysR family transcriptional regulator n=1 Tax=Methylobacterium hispanicum TaxID=270350 RepID=UPI002F35ACB9